MMYPDIAAHPHTLAVRPVQDAYRSMPGTPMGMDPRGLHSIDLAAAMNHARSGLEKANASDYFLSAPQYQSGVMRPRSPMIPLSGHESYHGNGLAMNGNNHDASGFRDRDRERDLEDEIRQANMSASLRNGSIINPARFAQVFPMKCEDGSYPPDYKHAKTVETMKVLDNSQLDRIMQAYRLPLDLRPVHLNGHQSRDSTSSSRVRQKKLHLLWEYLGAYNLLEYERVISKLQH
ncbi:hypothetical protein XPA_003957 [Xanthoria parietina]